MRKETNASTAMWEISKETARIAVTLEEGECVTQEELLYLAKRITETIKRIANGSPEENAQ